MVQRVSMINSNKTQLNSDYDFSKLRRRLLWNQGGIESKAQFTFDSSTKKLSAGTDIAAAYILCTRPSSSPIPNQQFLAHFEFTGTLDFLNITDGDKIFIEIKENLVKDPTLIEDLDIETDYAQGLGIGEIKMAKSYPTHSNYLKLYERNWGKLADLRKEIGISALDVVASKTATLESKVEKTEEKIEKLQESGTASYLGITGIVGEKYTAEDTLFLQKLSGLDYAIIALNVGDVAANKEQHIQRISNGKASNQLQLKMDKVLSPTANVVVEVRKGTLVDVSNKEAYRYGGWELLASATLPYTTITTTAKAITITLNKSFQLPEGWLYSIVVKQAGGIVNADNYYRIYCESKQYSEAFSCVAVNWGSRVRSKLMPYCMGASFKTELLCKIKKESYHAWESVFTVGSGATGVMGAGGRQEVFGVNLPNFYGKVGVYTIVKWSGNEGSGDLYGGISVSNGGQKTQLLSVYWSSASLNHVTEIKDFKSTDRVSVFGYNDGGNSNTNTTANFSKIEVKLQYIIILAQQLEHYPRWTASVWSSVQCTIFGFHTDNAWKGGVSEEVYTSATTGTINLWPAVGFVLQRLPNGKRIKIPFYGE